MPEITELTLRGSYFNAGHLIGRLMKKAIEGYISYEKKIINKYFKKNHKIILAVFKRLEKSCYQFLEELRGMAEGAGVSLEDIFLINLPEILSLSEDRCTSIALKNKYGSFIFHNEDELNWKTQNNYAILNYRLKNGLQYSAFSSPPELAGNAFSWNDYLFYAVDFLMPLKIDLKGIPRYFESRGLVEQTSIKEAIEYLKSFSNMSAHHYLIGDKSGRVVSIEKVNNKINILNLDTENFLYCHTNHYLHPCFKEKEKQCLNKADLLISKNSSEYRLKIAKKYLSFKDSPKKIIKILRGPLKQPIKKTSMTKTFATAAANLTNLTNQIQVKIISK